MTRFLHHCRVLLVCHIIVALRATAAAMQENMMNRRLLMERLSGATLLGWALLPYTASALARPATSISSSSVLSPITDINGVRKLEQACVAYKPLSISMQEFNVEVPVACWFPIDSEQSIDDTASLSLKPETQPQAVYQHRISVRRIGQLLAGWDFIPDFVSKSYQMAPSSETTNIVDGSNVPLPTTSSLPVVLLAHGYLGSRFDLSHLAEELSAAGFICIAAEYPESLASSYDRAPGLDRTAINAVLLNSIRQTWKLQPSSFGIVGHSLGCGTVLQTGDETWARVSIAGFPRNRDGSAIPGNGLLLASTNDGAVSLGRMGGMDAFASSQYEMLSENAIPRKLPRRAALVFDRPDAPNHISFLSEGVNEAMMDFLSPLLPVAKAFQIPVLDFDRYQTSRDSVATASKVHPLVTQYLKQEMLR